MKCTKALMSILFASMILCMLSACNVQNRESSDQRETHMEAKLTSEAVRDVGMPAIKNFREKRILKQILEMQDRAILTYTYLPTFQGLYYVGQSIGYPIPGGTQYTNPDRVVQQYSGAVVLPQADPDDLFSPAEAEGSYVLIQNPANPKDVEPVYFEPRIIVSPFKLTFRKVSNSGK